MLTLESCRESGTLCWEAGGISGERAAVEVSVPSGMGVQVVGLEHFTPERPARLATWLLPTV